MTQLNKQKQFKMPSCKEVTNCDGN